MVTTEPPRRFFVEIFSSSPDDLPRLYGLGLDLFRTTAGERKEGSGCIEGLVTLEEVGWLVEQGYRVLVSEAASKRARAADVAEFAQWLQMRGL